MSPRFHPLARLCIAAVGIVMAAICVVAVIFAALATAAKSSGKTATDFSGFLDANAVFLNLPFYALGLLVLWACRRLLDRQSFRSLGLRARGFLPSFSSGALAAILTLSLLFGTLYLCGQVRVNGFSLEYSKSNVALSLLAFALFFLAVGLAEEVVFRGYALHNLHAWLGAKWAIAIQALVFALVHLGNIGAGGASFSDARWGIVNIALIGVFFALCYLKSGSLWFPISFHAAWNFALGCFFSVPVSGVPVFRVLDVSVAPSFITGGTFGLEGSILLTPLILALCTVVSQMPNHAQTERDLSLLRTVKQIARDEEIVAQSIEETTSHLSNIRASMRPDSPSPQLDLRGINTMNSSPKTPSFEIFTPSSTSSSAPSTNWQTDIATTSTREVAEQTTTLTPPILAVESEAPFATPSEIAVPIENIRVETVAPQAEVVPEIIEETTPQKTAPITENAPVVVEETPIEAMPSGEKIKPKKPAPKW